MKGIIGLLIIAMAAVMVACAGKKKEETGSPKSIVIYYSQNGTTKALAETIQLLTGSDMEAIEAEEPYAGNFEETIARVKAEREANTLPKLKPLKANLDDYEIVDLGYPIWFGTFAPPMAAFVKDANLEGKKVVPFCTFGSGGLEASIRDLKSVRPNVEFAGGYGVRTARIGAMPEEVGRFLIENGYVEGKVEPLPEYSEQKPVTEAETAIFNAACGDYEYPLGTPVAVGKRATSKGTDYKYAVKSQSPDGSVVEATIYVTVGNEENAKPEFTRVDR